MAEPAVVSIMEFPGDPAELEERMRVIDEVGQRKAPEYGGISTTVVRTDTGVMVINMWADEEGRHRMAEDPEIQQAIQESGLPRPAFKGYEVIRHRSAEHATA
jgi:hypothetical protein